jgi:hypothetical protein
MVTKSRSPRKTTSRKKPGSTGEGDYYHVELTSTRGFEAFRTQDVGRRGHIQRVAGKKADGGSWQTVKWLIGKKDAHRRGNRLVPDSKGAKDVIEDLGVQPVHISGDRFKVNVRAGSGKKSDGSSGRRIRTKQAPARRPTRKTSTSRSRK